MKLLVLCCLLGGGLGLSLPELTLTKRLQDVARNIPTRCVEHSVTPVSCADGRHSDALVAHPDDCQLFYYCEESRSSPTCRQCPAGLHFNPTLHVCDWPQNAGCTAEAPTTTAAPTTTTTTAAPTTTTAAGPTTNTTAASITESPHNSTKPTFNTTTSSSTNNSTQHNTTKPPNVTVTPTIPSNSSSNTNTSTTKPYSTTTAPPFIVNSTDSQPSNVTWSWVATTVPSNSTSTNTAWEPLNGNDHRSNMTWPQNTQNNSSNYTDYTTPGSSSLPTRIDTLARNSTTAPSPTGSQVSSTRRPYTTSRPLNSTTKASSTPAPATSSFRHTTLGWRLLN